MFLRRNKEPTFKPQDIGSTFSSRRKMRGSFIIVSLL